MNDAEGGRLRRNCRATPPWCRAPGCRFAGRFIPRTSGKLASVWSPDAVNDAGGMDGCTVFVVPRRHGRICEHGRGDQSHRNRLIVARLHMTLNGSRASFFRIGAALHHMLIYINIVPEYGG